MTNQRDIEKDRDLYLQILRVDEKLCLTNLPDSTLDLAYTRIPLNPEAASLLFDMELPSAYAPEDEIVIRTYWKRENKSSEFTAIENTVLWKHHYKDTWYGIPLSKTTHGRFVTFERHE